MNNPSAIQPFEEFRESLSSMRYPEARELLPLKADNEAFDQMREFLLNRYQGVGVRHSFLERGGEVVDCIPVEEQLSLRDGGDVPVSPSDPPAPVGGDHDAGPAAGPTRQPPPHLHPDYRDVFGNQMWCPPGTVPVLRHTLARLAADHTTLDGFLRGPASTGEPRRHAAAKRAGDNHGGASNINIWPQQLFPPSLMSTASQQWYSNAELPFVDYQSVECGWRAGVIEGAVADSPPRLFVFYTRENHTPGNSCYNDYCPNGFAYATGASHILHAALSPVSQLDGVQWDIRMGFTLTGGKWWFHVSGAWIGCYPASLFGNGTLSTGATFAEFGGETTGIGLFPPMGSGRFPTEGFGKAAYQRLVDVNDTAGIPSQAQLVAGSVSPNCYNIELNTTPSSEWGSHFYFGGPGGINCP